MSSRQPASSLDCSSIEWFFLGTPGLIFGAVGILLAFTYYGDLQETVMDYKDKDGLHFKDVGVWLLQVVEAGMNVIVSFIGLNIAGRTHNLPLKWFCMTGTTQVLAKASMLFAMKNGLAFAISTLAKSAKMLPVMVGGILLGGKVYSLRQYVQVGAIVLATVLVSMSSKKGGSTTSSFLGFVFIIASLVFDGLTGGIQDRIRKECKDIGVKVKPFDMMFWTNVVMLVVATLFAFVWPAKGGGVQMVVGFAFIMSNPAVMTKIISFACCSAFGQCFIFFVVANFGSLKCSTITTTRKIISVLWSIFTKGYTLEALGYVGLALGAAGIVGELIPDKSHDEARHVHPVQPGADQENSKSVCSEMAASSVVNTAPMLAQTDDQSTSASFDNSKPVRY